MKHTKDKMKVYEFLEYQVNCYNKQDKVMYIKDVREITLNKKKYVEFVMNDIDEDLNYPSKFSGLTIDDLSTKLQAQDQNLYVVMNHPKNWSKEHEYVVGSSGGAIEIIYLTNND